MSRLRPGNPRLWREPHREVAAKYGLKVLGKLPMEPKLAAACDWGAIELFEGGWLDGAADLIESLPQREL